ncbi:fimbria/pilus outer membrane usher protein [Massilia sp.]|uniref:fimbria/pilus outer membrane usher protein n=1 Tax=Massilia sp. TaxID=1882437 RepID=UPI0028AD1C7D|nr:fimbria/pilus outer membrane usher protein [Massilia sp.]
MKRGGNRARALLSCAFPALATAFALAAALPLPARAQAGAPAPILPANPANAAAPVELYLEVTLNGAATGAVARFTRGPQGLRVDADTLRELGLDPAVLGFGDARERDLDALPGLSYSFDAAAQSIALRLADALRTPVRLQARNARPVGAGSASPGMLLNYDVYAQLGANARTSMLHELRWFDERGALSSTGVVGLSGGGRRYLRHDTSWSWADPVALTSLQVGDLITRSLSWSRSLRIGGIEWRKNFDLRPDLVTYPMARIAGSAVVPSSVALYVNGMQQYSSTVPDGPFVLDQVAGLNGAGQATVVTRDSLGREVATSVPLYVDTRLLAPGLSDYAVAFGLPRRDYGLRSFSYAARPALTGSLRHGVNDALTLEAHAEAGAGVANAGAGALVRLGHAGVLHGALAASGGDGRGVQATLGYQYLSPRLSIDVQSTRASAGYADLGTREGVPVSRVDDRITANFSPSAGQSVSASLVAYRLAGGAPGQATSRIASLAWSMRLGEGAYLGVNAYQDLGLSSARGVSASLSFSLPGRIGASVGGGRRGGDPTWNVGLNRSADFAGGFGWNVQSASQAGQRYGQAQLQYLGNAGQVGVLVQDSGAAVTTALNATGALVAMDGALLPARQVGRAFALVSAGVADVPVLQENRVIGRTDRHGRLLVPDLVPYAANQLAIDASDLPLDVRVRATSVEIAPRLLSGVVAGFTLERYQAASVTVHDAQGRPVALGTAVEVDGGAATIVGHDGVVFVENAGADNRLVLRARDGACEVKFRYPAAAAAAASGMASIGPLTCVPIKGGK